MNTMRTIHLCLLTLLIGGAVIFSMSCDPQTANIDVSATGQPPLSMQKQLIPPKDETVRFLLRPADAPQPHEEGSFVDDRNAWVSSGGKILRTTDGGRMWHEIYLSAEHAALFGELGSMNVKLDFVTPSQGWLMADSGTWRTSDGGTQWRRISTNLYDGLYFVDEQHGWISLAEEDGQRGYITQDAGHTWQSCDAVLNGDAPVPRQAYFHTSQQGWAITSQTGKDRQTTYGIARTSDGGCRWQQVWISDEDPDERFSALHFINEREGWLAGEYRLYHTTDGGKTWLHAPIPTEEMQLSGLYFADSNNGWIIAAPKTDDTTGVYRTTNGGKRWQQLTVNELTRGKIGDIPVKWKAGKLLQMLYAGYHRSR